MIEAATLFLPVVMAAQIPLASIGVQVDSVGWQYDGVDYAEFIRPDRTYQFNIRWMDVEQTRGVYTWPSYVDNNVDAVAGQPVILGTRTCPTWAREWPQYPGSPPMEAYWPDFAAFVIAAIERYSERAGALIAAVELWNEPNTQANIVPLAYQEYFGAWIGVDGSVQAAGNKYGRFLAIVEPLIRERYPGVRLIGGALMGNSDGLSFTQSALAAGGEDVDAWSFHAYLHQGSTDYEMPFRYAGQLAHLTGLPLYLTEMSIIGYDDTPLFRATQADYIRYVRAGMRLSPIEYASWYSMFNDWEFTALIRDGLPTPAFEEWSR